MRFQLTNHIHQHAVTKDLCSSSDNPISFSQIEIHVCHRFQEACISNASLKWPGSGVLCLLFHRLQNTMYCLSVCTHPSKMHCLKLAPLEAAEFAGKKKKRITSYRSKDTSLSPLLSLDGMVQHSPLGCSKTLSLLRCSAINSTQRDNSLTL